MWNVFQFPISHVYIHVCSAQIPEKANMPWKFYILIACRWFYIAYTPANKTLLSLCVVVVAESKRRFVADGGLADDSRIKNKRKSKEIHKIWSR